MVYNSCAETIIYAAEFPFFMKFAHLADVHIGAWRDQKMASLPDLAFQEAISAALAEQVDFILIAGDLFHTALPGIDHLRHAVKVLQIAKQQDVPVYVIPGSHDFSPSGKSMLHVLEEAGLLIDVFKGEVVDGKLRLHPVIDEQTGCLLTGILGKRGMLDRQQYEDLDKEWLKEKMKGAEKKVFLFHTSIAELKPKELSSMQSSSVSMLPEGFGYYAGGHVHIVGETKYNGGAPVVYPGPVFPDSFAELEKLGTGNMVIVEDFVPRNVPIRIKEVVSLSLRVDNQAPAWVSEELVKLVEKEEVNDAIVLLRVQGSLVGGGIADIDFRQVFSRLYAKGVFFVMRSTSMLSGESTEEEFEQIPANQIEENLIGEFSGKIAHPFKDEKAVMKSLLQVLSQEKAEGETNSVYEERILEAGRKVLE